MRNQDFTTLSSEEIETHILESCRSNVTPYMAYNLTNVNIRFGVEPRVVTDGSKVNKSPCGFCAKCTHRHITHNHKFKTITYRHICMYYYLTQTHNTKLQIYNHHISTHMHALLSCKHTLNIGNFILVYPSTNNIIWKQF